ncbi:MAG TPA: protein kinase [Polyangiaceae bacterium]|nr:protein kinase [Polyangiaceae bacterium]
MSSSDSQQHTDAPPVVPGQVLAGKFRIERVIGEGGMGIVAEAMHLQLDERVALKFLRREVMSMPDVVARFDREARAAVKLKSEHVARVMDVGHTEDGIPYMVMEYLEGHDLGHVVAENGPLSISDAVEFTIQACEGVGEAHARGIVHRDLKPENLFVSRRSDGWRTIKVLDFGISKAVLVGPSSVDLSSHNTSGIMGSPFYMSPEQLRSTRTVDHRADVWSLGVVLFELLTGTTIFDEANEFTELVADILEAPHRSLRAFRPDAPKGLEEIVDRCLEKDRSRRYQNVAELAVALLAYAPKRSRVSAERIMSITKAAGLITDPSFRLPSSDIPPPPSTVRDSTTPMGFGMPPLPTFEPSIATSETMRPPAASHPQIDDPTLIGGPAIFEETKGRKRRRRILGAGGVVLVAGVVLFFALRSPKLQPSSVTSPASPESPESPEVHPVPAAAIRATPPVTAFAGSDPPPPIEAANARAGTPTPQSYASSRPLPGVAHHPGVISATPPSAQPSAAPPPPPPTETAAPPPPKATADVLDERR